MIVVYSVRGTSVGRMKGQLEQGPAEATQAHPEMSEYGDDARTEVRRHQRAAPFLPPSPG